MLCIVYSMGVFNTVIQLFTVHVHLCTSKCIYCKTTFFRGSLFAVVGRLIRFRGVQCSRFARFFFYNHTIWQFFAGLIFADFQKIAKSAKNRPPRKKWFYSNVQGGQDFTTLAVL